MSDVIRLTMDDLHAIRVYFAHRNNGLNASEAWKCTDYEVFFKGSSAPVASESAQAPRAGAEDASPYDFGFFPVVKGAGA